MTTLDDAAPEDDAALVASLRLGDRTAFAPWSSDTAPASSPSPPPSSTTPRPPKTSPNWRTKGPPPPQ